MTTAHTSEWALEAVGLTKRFGSTQALDGIDLAARPGTVLGVLGPNGAGKTTAVRILSTLLKPDAGVARILGVDVRADPERVRRSIGLTGQYASVGRRRRPRRGAARGRRWRVGGSGSGRGRRSSSPAGIRQ